MGTRDKLPKVADADRESQYGYVFGVSGPGMFTAPPSLERKDRSILLSPSRHGQSYGGFGNQ